MKFPSKFTCVMAASFMTVTPYTPQQFLTLAKERVSVSEKISILKRLSDAFPLDASAKTAHAQLIDLLLSTNRYEEALQEYRQDHPESATDFKFLDMLLRTGRYKDVLRATGSFGSIPQPDLRRDLTLLE